MNIGVIFLNRGDMTSAIKWMGKALEVDPSYIRGYYNLGTLHLRAGHFRRAIDIFNRALQIEPGHPDCEDIVTNLYAAQDKLESAEEEMLALLRGDHLHVDLGQLKTLADALLPVQIESVDVAISTGNTYRLLAHAAHAHFEAVLEDGELKIRQLDA